MHKIHPGTFTYTTQKDPQSIDKQILDISFKHGDHSCVLEVREDSTYRLFFVAINETSPRENNNYTTSPKRTLIRSSEFPRGLQHLVGSYNFNSFATEQVREIVSTVKDYLAYERK